MVSAAHVFDEFEFDGTERQRSTHRRLVTNGFLITVNHLQLFFLFGRAAGGSRALKMGSFSLFVCLFVCLVSLL